MYCTMLVLRYLDRKRFTLLDKYTKHKMNSSYQLLCKSERNREPSKLIL